MKEYPNFTIIIDTREQKPWYFPNYTTANKKLDTGDYSIEGLEDVLAIERKKSVSEIANNITEKRFKDVLERLKNTKYAFMLMEFDLKDVMNFPIGSNVPQRVWSKLRISSNFIIKNLVEFQTQYNINLLFCGSPSNAAKMATSILRNIYEKEGNNQDSIF